MRTLEEAVEFHNMLPIPLPSILFIMAKIKVNGKEFDIKSFSLKDHDGYIDDEMVVRITPTEVDEKKIVIEIYGDVYQVSVDNCDKVVIAGNAGNVSTNNGDIEVGVDIHGSVKTINGDIRCKKIHGNANTINGDIEIA